MSRPDLTTQLQRSIQSRQPASGLIVKMPCPSVIELAGHVGFDLVVIDTEHGIDGGRELEDHIRAADSVAIATVVRVPENSRALIQRSLDAGAAGIIVPHIQDATAAAAAVDAARYPPNGSRGLALSTRAGWHGTRDLNEHLDSAGHVVVIAQIEDSLGVTNVAEIAAVNGITALWCGPSDLSMSLGQPGGHDHPDVVRSIAAVANATIDADGPALCVLTADVNTASEHISRGAALILFTLNDLIIGPLGAASGTTLGKVVDQSANDG